MGKNRVSDVVEKDKKLGLFALFRYATCTDILLNIASGRRFFLTQIDQVMSLMTVGKR